MRFIRKIKNLFIPLKETSLTDIDMKPGETIIAIQEDKVEIGEWKRSREYVYGVCGVVCATQLDLNRQLEYKPTLLLGHQEAPCIKP